MSYLDDYRNKINLVKSLTPSSEFMLNEMKKQFKDYLQITPTKKTIKVDNTEYVADIQDVSQINKNNNDEKYCITEFGLNIQIGNIVTINEFDNKTWLVTEKENMTIKDRQRYKIRPCNNVLKLYNKLSKLISVPIISENKTLWTLGVSETTSSPIITGDAKLNIIMPDNNDTKYINRDTRLICDGLCWKVTIKSANNQLATLVCGETQEMKGLDDMINEIPANPYTFITLSFTQSSYTLQKDSNLTLTPILKQGDKTLILSDFPLSWSVDNQGVASVNNGIVTGIGVGISKIRCSLVGNENVWGEVNAEVTESVPISNTYVIEGEGVLKKTMTQTYVAKVYNNLGQEVLDRQFDFRIANYNGIDPSTVSLTIINDKTVKIKNISAISGKLYLVAQDRNSIYYADMDIELKGIYG